MSGVNPRDSFSQGPDSWRPHNPVDTALGREFSHGVFTSVAHDDNARELGSTLAFGVGFIAGILRRGGG